KNADILRIGVGVDRNGRIIHVSRLTGRGVKKSEGYTYVTDDQKVVRVTLDPVDGAGVSVRAVIKMHFETDHEYCTEDNLVPILTLQKKDPSKPKSEIQYRMKRVPGRQF